MTTEVQAILWACDGVLTDQSHPKRSYDRMEEALQHFVDNGISMAVVDRLPVPEIRARLDRAGLSHFFSGAGGPLNPRIYSAADTPSDKPTDNPLTLAHRAAIVDMGLDIHATIAVVGDYMNVKSASYSGVPVFGLVAGTHTAFENAAHAKSEMVYQGAKYAASAVIDLVQPVMQFRPWRPAVWHPIGQGLGS